MNASQIATLINEVYSGVDRSKLGPIQVEQKNGLGTPAINGLAFQTFLTILPPMIMQEAKVKHSTE